MALRIRIEHGQDAGKTFRLGAPGAYRFGRSPATSVQIIDMKVSKEHFEIWIRNGAASSAAIRDLESSHGTLLNGQKVDSDARPLSAGDEIRAGLTVIRVLSDGPSDAEAKLLGPIPEEASSGARGSTSSTTTGGANDGAAPAPAATVGKPAAKALPADALVGTTLAGYKILEKVGAGGMGAVYRAEQLSLHREVALKVLAEKLVSDSAFVDQFVNEARAAGQLNHPNVVQVYDVGQADGRHFFSMEYIHGGSLESKIPKGKAGVPWQEALPWFLDAANALIFAEKKGILHRDIKPDNFMLGQDGSVKLCDLGLAKKSESADLLAQGIIGTPHFISPEAIRRRSDVDPRADLYSLGCTFYRLLTGKNPYPGGSVKEILLAHLNQPVPHANVASPEVSKDVDDVVFRLMQKEPSERFQNSAELWESLDKIRLEHGMAAHGLHPGRAKKFAILGGLIAAAAVGTLIYLKPWEDKTRVIKETEIRDRPTGVPQEKLDESNAMVRFGQIQNASLQRPGRLEEGENWRSAEWDGYLKSYESLATELSKTEGAQHAREEIDKIKSYRTKMSAKADAREKAVKAAAQQVASVASEATAKAVELKDKPLEADAAISTALTTIATVAKGTGVDGPLLTDEQVKPKTQPLEWARAALLKDINDGYSKLLEEVETTAKPATAEAMATASGLLQGWLDSHPEATGEGEVAKAWNDTRRRATAQKTLVMGDAEAVRRKDLLADRKEAFDYQVRYAYAPRADDGSTAGYFQAFRNKDAKEKATALAKSAKTPEYRAWFEMRARDAGLLETLPGILANGFVQKGWKDKLSGNGWTGTVKAVTPEGVEVLSKLRPYAVEGLSWYYELFYEKAAGGALQERYPLDADAHEALGILAEAAGILERPAMIDAAVREWQQAGALDPKRVARLAPRIEAAKAEQVVKTKLDESYDNVEKTVSAMEKLEEALSNPNAKGQEVARKTIEEKKGEFEKKLIDARKLLEDVEANFPTSIGRALLVDAAPANAAYAGETLPAAPPEPPKTPPPGPAPGPAPAPSPTPAPGGAPTPGPIPAPGSIPGATPPPVPVGPPDKSGGSPQGPPPAPGMSEQPAPTMGEEPPAMDTPGGVGGMAEPKK